MADRLITTEIFVHCSASKPSQMWDVDDIRQIHIDKGWSDVGYHFVLPRQGGVQQGRPLNAIGAHVRGHNTVSVGICMIGGVNAVMEPENNFTDDQWFALEKTYDFLSLIYPDAKWMGHNEVSNKACPSFNVQTWLSDLRDPKL